MSMKAQHEIKLTRRWGDEEADNLWEGFLGKYPVEWQDKTVLDFGCAWGYVPRMLVERRGAACCHGVDIHAHWERMPDQDRPDRVEGVRLYKGVYDEIEELREVELDVAVSSGTLFLLTPSELDHLLGWFYERLRPGGVCLFNLRTNLSYAGDDVHDHITAPFPHLLFSRRVLNHNFEARGKEPVRYMSPACTATYLMQFHRAGFELVQVRRYPNPFEESVYEEHADKLGFYEPGEMRTSQFDAFLRKPASRVLPSHVSAPTP